MEISFREITKNFDETTAVDSLSVDIKSGELVCLLGPSGCGKSTTLSMLAGLINPNSGTILFGGKDVTDIPPEKRDIGMVFQNYALYPHMSVEQNIAFPLKMRGVSKRDRNALVEEMLELLHLHELRKRKPSELSGGQQQRVAIARALVKKPSLLLLDEPFSNLDARLRLVLRDEIRHLQKKLGITTVFVTHDQEEALSISDRILVLDKGVMQQYSSPKEMYENPVNPFVAGFIGNPPMNFIEVEFNGRDVFADDIVLNIGIMVGDMSKGRKLVGIRPEDVYPASNGIETTIVSQQPIGKDIYLTLNFGTHTILSVVSWDNQYQEGQKLIVSFRKARLFSMEEQHGQG